MAFETRNRGARRTAASGNRVPAGNDPEVPQPAFRNQPISGPDIFQGGYLPKLVCVVTRGRVSGFLLRTAKGTEAYSRSEELIGVFSDAIAAAQAVEAAAREASP
jgi:hypothetical protein